MEKSAPKAQEEYLYPRISFAYKILAEVVAQDEIFEVKFSPLQGRGGQNGYHRWGNAPGTISGHAPTKNPH